MRMRIEYASDRTDEVCVDVPVGSLVMWIDAALETRSKISRGSMFRGRMCVSASDSELIAAMAALRNNAKGSPEMIMFRTPAGKFFLCAIR